MIGMCQNGWNVSNTEFVFTSCICTTPVVLKVSAIAPKGAAGV